MTVLLNHDVFFGQLQSTRSLDGITFSHRVANSPPEEVGVHTHVEAHFVLVTSGRYVSSAKGVADRGTILICNPPGTTHRDHFEEGKGSFFSISVSNRRLAESTDSTLLPAAPHLGDERTCGLARTLFMECARWNASSSLHAESLYAELIVAACEPREKSEIFRPSWLREAVEMIQDCYMENPGIRNIAKVVGVHPTHLARSFRSFLGCTPGDMLRLRRLAKAAELLLLAGNSIAEIALLSGFSDQAQFTKAFRRVYGTTPAEYRRLSARGVSNRRRVAF